MTNTAIGVTRPRHRSRAFVKMLGARVSAGVTGGIVLGVGLRIAMRVAAVVEGQTPEFTIGGTIFILMFGAAIGAMFGPLIFAAAKVLGRRRPVVVSGLVATGVLLGLLIGVTGQEFFEVGAAPVNALTFGASTFALGAVGKIVELRILDRRPETAARLGAGIAAGGAAGAIVGLIGSPVLAWLLDRVDGGAPHSMAPSIRIPRVADVGDVVAIAVGSLVNGLLLGAILGAFLVWLLRFAVVRRLQPSQAAALVAGVAVALIGLPGAARSGFNGLAVGVAAAALMVPFVHLLLRWELRFRAPAVDRAE